MPGSDHVHALPSRHLVLGLALALLCAPHAARSQPASRPVGPATLPTPSPSVQAAPARAAADAAPEPVTGRVARGRTTPAHPPRPRWLVPALHTGGLLLVVRAGASLLWPETYDLTRVDRNADVIDRDEVAAASGEVADCR